MEMIMGTLVSEPDNSASSRDRSDKRRVPHSSTFNPIKNSDASGEVTYCAFIPANEAPSNLGSVKRERISERMKLLQDLVPGCNKITEKLQCLMRSSTTCNPSNNKSRVKDDGDKDKKEDEDEDNENVFDEEEDNSEDYEQNIDFDNDEDDFNMPDDVDGGPVR
ncbi:hypothetical protein L6452_39533 [Arctium lappa]|uniref:Uncharacterized protein n=1 Tax=Arctium lappa TaxID=4217 RepID=A0ACB8XTQ1_ARCLA|nr:hypothetical protein L6452_39533 [Arctium lappa]